MHAAIRHDDAEFAARIDSQILRDIYAYWQSQRGMRAMPARADIQPMEIPRLLRHVYLIDVLSDPRDYRHRLVGTAIGERYGDERTGKLVSEVFVEPTLSLVRRIYATVVDERRPVLASGPVEWRNDRHSRFECIFLPLSDNGTDVNMIFGGLVFTFSAKPGDGITFY